MTSLPRPLTFVEYRIQQGWESAFQEYRARGGQLSFEEFQAWVRQRRPVQMFRRDVPLKRLLN